MKNICWQGKPFKQLSFGKIKSAGRNSAGCITVFHRGGGSKRLHRKIDFQRNTLSTGVVERIEYDPNRTSRIALIRWSSLEKASAQSFAAQPTFCEPASGPKVRRSDRSGTQFFLSGEPNVRSSSNLTSYVRKHVRSKSTSLMHAQQVASASGGCVSKHASHVLKESKTQRALFSYIIACDQLKSGDEINNLVRSNRFAATSHASFELDVRSTDLKSDASIERENLNLSEDSRLFQKIGTNCTLAKASLGSIIHHIEAYPGQGGKLVRAAGTFAQLVQKFDNTRQCIVRLPSGSKRVLDLQCRATIGIVSNTSHSTRKLTKAGQSRWLGRLPVVRGVAMNPIDHPHGGGEGRTKGGRPSVSPWGKPAKGSKKGCASKVGKV